MKRMALCAAALGILGCSATYLGPTTEIKAYAMSVPGTRAEIYAAALTVLAQRGFTVENSDEPAGYLMTNITDVDFSSRECDCGMLGGLDAADEFGTRHRYMLEMRARDNVVELDVGIDGWYVDSKGDSTKLQCVSNGFIEKSIGSAIIRQINR